jgi:IclR family acetate operon transcriptional repressor
VRLISRAFAILDQLSVEPTGLTLQELSNRTDVPVGSVHRLMGVLMEESLVVRSASTLRYFVGPAAATLGMAGIKSSRLLQEPPASIAEAAASCEESFHLTELVDERHAVCVAAAHGRRLPHPPALLGREFPLGMTPPSRVLLVGMHESFIAKAVRHNVAPFDYGEVMTRVRSVQRSGFDAAPDEPEEGLWTLSVPVYSEAGPFQRCVSVVASARRARRASTRLALYNQVVVLARRLADDGAANTGPGKFATLISSGSPRLQEGVCIAGVV